MLTMVGLLFFLLSSYSANVTVGTCTSSGSATTYESRLPSNSYDDRSDDWFDDSVSSNSSALL